MIIRGRQAVKRFDHLVGEAFRFNQTANRKISELQEELRTPPDEKYTSQTTDRAISADQHLRHIIGLAAAADVQLHDAHAAETMAKLSKRRATQIGVKFLVHNQLNEALKERLSEVEPRVRAFYSETLGSRRRA
jgi:hypothetical protein